MKTIPKKDSENKDEKKRIIGEDTFDSLEISKPSKYEITDDLCFPIKFGLIGENNTKRWRVVQESESDKVENHWVEFRMWNYDEDIDLKKRATTYDKQKRTHFLDHDLLNRMKVQLLLKNWSFSKGDEKMKLLHVNGLLSDQSWEQFKKLQPTIIRYILDKMNEVLEFNG